MVTYEEFKNVMMDKVEEEIGNRAVIQRFPRLNGTSNEGLVIMSAETNVSPVIYLKQYYDAYLEIMDEENAVESVWSDIKKCYFDNLPVNRFDSAAYLDYDKIKRNLRFRLVNYKRNEEWLQEISHVRFLDLAIIFTVRVIEESNREGTITVHREHQYVWKKSDEELLHDAMENMRFDYELVPIEKIIEAYKEESGSDEDVESLCDGANMFVLSNKIRNYGAAAILCPHVLEAFAERCGCDMVAIIPSSVHEVILFPCEADVDCDYLKALVESVNATNLEEEEVLSDHVYLYDRKQDKIISA
jgi:hypothetical protein